VGVRNEGEGEPPAVLGSISVSAQFHGWVRSCGGIRKSESVFKKSNLASAVVVIVPENSHKTEDEKTPTKPRTS
jgi:hypothetical protein